MSMHQHNYVWNGPQVGHPLPRLAEMGFLMDKSGE